MAIAIPSTADYYPISVQLNILHYSFIQYGLGILQVQLRPELCPHNHVLIMAFHILVKHEVWKREESRESQYK